jgi:hypothetical protein
MEEIINNFNTIALEFATQIGTVCPTSFIANNIDILTRVIKQEPQKILDLFVEYVLKYKPQIDAKDEKFFMNNTFSNDIEGNSDAIGKIFEFKTFWKQLSHHNKEIVQQYMQFLCQLALSYTDFLVNQKN